MTGRLIYFPASRSVAQPYAHDALARDTQSQASRIAAEVEQRLAMQARRAAHTNKATVVVMPASPLTVLAAARPHGLTRRLARAASRRLLRWLRSL
jgi:hypothetical protein